MPALNSTSTLSVVRSIAENMLDLDRIKEIVLSTGNQNHDLLFPIRLWDDLSISGGYSGLLLFFAEMKRQFGNETWDLPSHHCVLKIKSALETQGINSFSMFGGLSGICYAIQQVTEGGTRYQRLLNSLNRLLLDGVKLKFLSEINEKFKLKQTQSPSHYDAIQGISGIGLYYLKNLETEPFLKDAVEMVRLCVELTKSIEIEGEMFPGWYVSFEDLTEYDKKKFPKGNFNLGLSHGIPGVLVFLSLALQHGIKIEGQVEAIECIAFWLQEKQKRDHLGCYWEQQVSFEDESSKRKQPQENSQRMEACVMEHREWLAVYILPERRYKGKI